MSFLSKNHFSVFRSAWQRSFFVTLFFVTLAALLFWLDTFHVYQSEVRVLVIGKVPTAATDQVVENFTELSKNLSFYEQVLERNDLIDDDFEGYSKDERKKLWNETVQVTRSEKSGVLSVVAKQDTPEKAKRLSEETTRTLFSVASFYYNIKTDIDMRVVDEPIVKTTVAHPVRYVLTSFVSALGVTLAFFLVLSAVPGFLGKRKEVAAPELPIGASVPFIDPKKFVPARPTSLSFESSHEEQAKEAEVPRVASERMLPGMDATELPFQFEESYPEEKEEEATFADLPVTGGVLGGGATAVIETTTEETPVKKEEPTPEEYKRRLNELLAGGK